MYTRIPFPGAIGVSGEVRGYTPTTAAGSGRAGREGVRGNRQASERDRKRATLATHFCFTFVIIFLNFWVYPTDRALVVLGLDVTSAAAVRPLPLLREGREAGGRGGIAHDARPTEEKSATTGNRG